MVINYFSGCVASLVYYPTCKLISPLVTVAWMLGENMTPGVRNKGLYFSRQTQEAECQSMRFPRPHNFHRGNVGAYTAEMGFVTGEEQ